MKLGIISDIHGNLHKVLRELYKREVPERNIISAIFFGRTTHIDLD